MICIYHSITQQAGIQLPTYGSLLYPHLQLMEPVHPSSCLLTSQLEFLNEVLYGFWMISLRKEIDFQALKELQLLVLVKKVQFLNWPSHERLPWELSRPMLNQFNLSRLNLQNFLGAVLMILVSSAGHTELLENKLGQIQISSNIYQG